VILVDDHLLATHLTGDLAPSAGPTELATTCSWWWRLAAALTGGRRGSLSRHFDASLEGDVTPVEVVHRLPERVTVLDLRELIPNMSRAAARYRLNLLAAEALVAAEVLGADIVVGQDTPRLREACRVRGVTYLVQT
jgi:hypothetical protein